MVIVAVCTFRRNGPLRTLLNALQHVAATTNGRARVGVVVVDDNPDERARPIVDEFRDAFEMGCEYRSSGKGNISLARNLAVDTASRESDWVAMTDDDCEPEPLWLCHHLDVLDATGADCATGPMLYRPTQSAPKWLIDQPFFEDVELKISDRTTLDSASTNNSIIRSQFLRAHPEIRFEPELGVLGGEDMVFYRTAHRNGLHIRFAAKAFVWGNEPPERCTFRHQVRYRFWLGNTEFVTNRFLGDASRLRLILRALRRVLRSSTGFIRRAAKREPLQVRYTIASLAGASGLLVGGLGLQKRHPE